MITYLRKISKLVVLISLFVSCKEEAPLTLDLSGDWNFKIDSLDVGVKEKLFGTTLKDTIVLPGSMAENGKGNDITVNTNWTGNMWNDSLWYKDPAMAKYRKEGNVKVPFWLNPIKTYKGAAWYQKEVNIPKTWIEKPLELHLERVHWESTVWVDDEKIGMKNSLATSHNYSIKSLTPGKHTISIRVDNSIKDIDVGVDAHSISDNTQTNWNGIIGDITLRVKPKITIRQVKLHPNIQNKTVRAEINIENISGIDEVVEISLKATEKVKNGHSLDILKNSFKMGSAETITLEYDMGDSVKLWDEFHPNLYEMQISVKSKEDTHVITETFGMRDFKTKGTIFTINDRPIFLRGTLECAIFPLTGYPPTDIDSWKHIYEIIKAHGLNHMRFHSWCPPEAALNAADEMGVYIQIEASAWATIGDGEPIDDWLYEESEAIIDAYGNHPSFVMMAYGNEPSGKNHEVYLENYVDHLKSLDNRRLYTSGAGWPLLDNLDYYNHKGPRIQGWDQNLESIINKYPPQTEFDWKELVNKTPMPYVSHEMGQWCVYPNFAEMSKYTGVLKPKNFEIFKETLNQNGMLELADEFLMASGKLQTLCYKADIEAALRTPGLAGFQLLDLHDFPGQGTALVGVLDAFWDEKGYISPETFKTFNDETVPLARLAKRTFLNSDTLSSKIEVAHFGKEPLIGVVPTWKIIYEDGKVFSQGTLENTTVTIGNGIQLGTIVQPLSKIEMAQKLTLKVKVHEFENSWDFWVYPTQIEPIENEGNFKVVSRLDLSSLNYLSNGGSVLLNITKGDIVPEKGGDIGIGFSSIFWNTSWTNGQKPHTLGILCNPKHPALAHFPTEYHSNWQWWDAMSNSNAVVLSDIPNAQPIVRVIDDWFKNRSTVLIFEARVGKGKLLFSGIDLHTNINIRPEAQQLLYSLKSYMVSNDFNPTKSIEISQLMGLLKYSDYKLK